MSTSASGGGPGKIVCDMDDHGVHGEMKNDAMNVAAAALEVSFLDQTAGVSCARTQ
jgi:hypothetical protein